MDDLKARLSDWQTVRPCDADKPEGHLYEEALARIEALEARVAAADKLAQLCRSFSVVPDSPLSRTLAAYEATKEQSK